MTAGDPETKQPEICKQVPSRKPADFSVGPSKRHNFSFGFGIFLMIFCSGLIVTYVAELFTGEVRHGVGSQMGLIVFLCGLVFVGWRMVESRLKESRALKELKEEQLIMNRARTYSGLLFISETALECQLSISDTKAALERLSRLGVCQVDVTGEGELCYQFPSLRTKNRNEEREILGIHIETTKIDLKQEQV
jgi:hypothetical protein